MEGSFAELFQQATWTVIRAALPVLLAAMVVGLIIGILQTATSIQEQTLSFVPKILAVMLTALFLGPVIFQSVIRLAVDVLGQLQTFIQ